MSRKKSKPLPTSHALVGARWELDDSSATVIVAECDNGRWADENWERVADASNSHWNWYELISANSERFALISTSKHSEVLALWCSAKEEGIVLDGIRYYRLDYFEIAPTVRGGIVGQLTIALIATRALELRCKGMVLQALPEPSLVSWYERLGAKQYLPRGWSRIGNLVPMVFEEAVLQALAEKANEIRQ